VWDPVQDGYTAVKVCDVLPGNIRQGYP